MNDDNAMFLDTDEDPLDLAQLDAEIDELRDFGIDDIDDPAETAEQPAVLPYVEPDQPEAEEEDDDD